MIKMQRLYLLTVAAAIALVAPARAQAPDLQAVARNLVQAGMVAKGDKVLITGSVRDAALLENIAIETMKAGGQPLISISSESLTRRSYEEVPEVFDSLPQTLGLDLVQTFDLQISVDVGTSESILAGIPPKRRAARAVANEPVTAAFLKRNIRLVSLGNGIYPTDTLAKRLGIPVADLANSFWRGAGVLPQDLRVKGESLRASFANAKQVTLTHSNGTNLTFNVDAGRGLVSDGALTPEKVRLGSAAASTWLPAGELILPAVPGSAEGKLVVDKTLWDGEEVTGLTLTFTKGHLTAMTAASNLSLIKAAYDVAGGAKDQFGYIDFGLNPETRLPVGTGRIIWTVPGAVTVGFGDNRSFGGSNASDFGLALQLGRATVKVDGKAIVENGVLK
jgi:leucyl aminopeptidase (aminopeptidase T)